jgi:hypothetical protein
MAACRARRLPGQMRNLPHSPGHGEDGRRRIALLAECTVPAAVHMIFTHVVFAGERMFVVPRTFM